MSPGAHRITVEAGRAPVVVHIPPKLLTGAPLVLALPGAGQTARDFAAYTGYSRLADAERVAVAYATASGSRPLWNVTDHIPGHAQDVPYLRAVIPAVVKAACADPARVGVTGVSNGGGMSARMACDAADLVAAAAPVAGGYGALPDCHPSRPVPILEIHGTADQVVPYAGKGTRSAATSRPSSRSGGGSTAAPASRGRAASRTASGSGARCAARAGRRSSTTGSQAPSTAGPAPTTSAVAPTFSSTRRTFDFLTSFRR